MSRTPIISLRKFGLVCLTVALGVALSSPSYAQSTKKRLDILEKQLKAVQRKVFKPGSGFSQKAEGTAPAGVSAGGGSVRLADIDARLSQMETQLRQLTGRIEESTYQADKLKQQMATMARDYEYRLGELEKSGAGGAATAQPVKPAPALPTTTAGDILPAGSEKQQYSYAQKLVTKGQYAKAEGALAEFLKRYPKAQLAGNAQYWLGQTYYVRKMYTKATRAFLEGYNSYPKSPKSPAFLLKIGMSLNAMGEKKDACDAYRELATRFPDSLESKSKRPAQEKRAGCR
ncbi:MAG: tol-pal system protein YbgF [Alphaproteobacteria bacterium]|nr:MAG: tol-pal system protein YbgF [Alphaproteobacteria bacterium]